MFAYLATLAITLIPACVVFDALKLGATTGRRPVAVIRWILVASLLCTSAFILFEVFEGAVAESLAGAGVVMPVIGGLAGFLVAWNVLGQGQAYSELSLGQLRLRYGSLAFAAALFMAVLGFTLDGLGGSGDTNSWGALGAVLVAMSYLIPFVFGLVTVGGLMWLTFSPPARVDNLRVPISHTDCRPAG